MKIALAGSHSTGKTTILNLLEGNKISEQARSLIAELGNPKDMSDAERENFQQVLLTRKIRAEIEAGNDFISDRSIYDILAYSMGGRNYNDLDLQATHYLAGNQYDIIFYFPIEFELEQDGVRPESIDYQKAIDGRILKLIGGKHITITGTIEERLEKIKAEIRKYEAKTRKNAQIG